MRYSIAVATAAVVAAGLAVPASADPANLPAPIVSFDNGPSASHPRDGYLRAGLPLGTDATAVVYTFADDAPAPDLSPETAQGMGPLLLEGVNGDQMRASSDTLLWSGYATRNFAVYATDGAGGYSAPTYFTVAAMSESAADPGPNPGFSYTWDWYSGKPEMRIDIDHDSKSTTYGVLAQGDTAAPDPPTAFADPDTYRLLPFGYEGAVFTPQVMESLDLTTGAPLTLTVFHYNLDFTHYTRTVSSIKAGRPTEEVVQLTGPSTRARPRSNTFHVQMKPVAGIAYDQAKFRIEIRQAGNLWKYFASITATRPNPATFTVPARTHGYEVRAILLNGGANLASPAHKVVLQRRLHLEVKEHVRPGTVHTARGVATGRLKGQTVQILRCKNRKNRSCTHYKTVRLSRDEHFSVKVSAPTVIDQKWFYIAVLPALDPWTPRTESNRAWIAAERFPG